MTAVYYKNNMLTSEKIKGSYFTLTTVLEVTADRFQMADSFIRRQEGKPDGLSVAQYLRMFGMSMPGYYSWIGRQKEADGFRAAKQENLNELKEKFRQIARKLGFVPGKRTFRTYLWSEFHANVSVKRCRKIMNEVNLVANRPQKDAYKHQATHDHEYASPQNAVKQDFYIGPRKVVLTDITYLYYGSARTPVYLCAFRDAYTKEILGHFVSAHMTAQLVRTAYDVMMEKHGCEIYWRAQIEYADAASQEIVSYQDYLFDKPAELLFALSEYFEPDTEDFDGDFEEE